MEKGVEGVFKERPEAGCLGELGTPRPPKHGYVTIYCMCHGWRVGVLILGGGNQ